MSCRTFPLVATAAIITAILGGVTLLVRELKRGKKRRDCKKPGGSK